MNKSKLTMKGIIIVALFIVVVSAMPVEAQTFLTTEEQDYINRSNIIEAVSVQGGAPLQYADANGQVQGISKEVLEEISDMTGMVFEYQLYDTLDEVFNSGADIVFGIPYNYATEDMVMSLPFLESETILYLNSSVDPNELDDKKFAATEGANIPEGIKEENAIYFATREASLDAVESGQADYGYGNAYSVAFYMLQNSYTNIITVPREKESREYCIGFLKDNEILLSIINKSIASIDETHMRTLILNATTQIDREITIPMIIDAYGIQIFGAIFLVMAILLLSIVHNIRAKNELKLQYERYQMLSQTSNEYLYEYYVRTKHLELSKNCIQLFENSDNLQEFEAVFKQTIINAENTMPIIELTIARGEKGLFKSVNSLIYDDKGRVYSIIGKLIDVSEEEAEKQELIKKSEIDGLIGLYNASTTRHLITESIINADLNATDALILIDCDKFKAINDTYGHLHGDKVLVNISKGLNQTFRKTDIIGRIGGDELCVYMRDISSPDFVVSKCEQLMALIQELNRDYPVTLSIGISLRSDEKSYDELFAKADNALYEAKKKGGAQMQFS
ncbi:MAG: GGDEF domain-containing protein [Syntrophomonas sp.]|nr:GGDEF domain-containing protein [Syntrophomonas sp.]